MELPITRSIFRANCVSRNGTVQTIKRNRVHEDDQLAGYLIVGGISAQKTLESAGSTLASMLWERWNLYRTSASTFTFACATDSATRTSIHTYTYESFMHTHTHTYFSRITRSSMSRGLARFVV